MRIAAAALLPLFCAAAAPAATVEVLGRRVELPAPVRTPPSRPCLPRPGVLTPLLWTATALQVYDGAVTMGVVSKLKAGLAARGRDPGAAYGVEVNGIMAPLLRRPAVFWSVKLGAASFGRWAIEGAACAAPELSTGLASTLAVLYGAVAVWNTTQYRAASAYAARGGAPPS